ncbi:MAG: hypothetical protein U0Q12_08455 [Vicinamibacterales bacterium]
MKRRIRLLAASLAAASSWVVLSAQAPGRVDVVAVTGCLVEQPADTWMLTSATDPVASIANGPPAGEPIKGPTSGKNQFKLIGTSEFDLPSLKGRIVLVKALLVKATPVSRLNVTSVTKVADTCTPAK